MTLAPPKSFALRFPASQPRDTRFSIRLEIATLPNFGDSRPVPTQSGIRK